MRLIYLGTGEIGLPTLRALLDRHEVPAVVTQPDQPAGRGLAVRAPAVKKLAEERGVPVLQPGRLRREPDAIEQMHNLRPEALVVFAYGQILPRAVLEIPSLAPLNIHASLLPRWRGAAPIQAAIRAGDALTGHTIMFMDEGLDTGDILLQHPLEIRPAETGGSLHDRLAELAPGAILEALDLLAAGRAPRIPQDAAQATLAPKLDRAAGRLDWTLPAAELARAVRAFDPWPGTFTTAPDGRVIKVFAADESAGFGSPGEVLATGSAGLTVACSSGTALRLRELQLEGRRRLPAGEFLRGFPLAAGTRLG